MLYNLIGDNMDKKILIGAIVLLVVIVLALLYIELFSHNKNDEYLKIKFFNVGKADSFLIYNSNYTVLIDTGENDTSKVIIDYLDNNKISKIDYLIITHFDKDHVGGASDIIKRYNIDKVLVSNRPKDSKQYEKFMDALEKKKITADVIREDFDFELGDSKFTVNAPKEEKYDNKPSNNSSLIVSLHFKDNSILFMGDAEELRIKEYLLEHTDTYDVLKVPYHGHLQENTEELISVVEPKYAIITSSLEEKEDEEVLSILTKYNVRYYLTREGSILLTSDGSSIDIKQDE